MDRAGGYGESYDPFRIPSAVFQRSSSVTPLEWSIASNESLFSIQVGNNSFSRDQVLMLNELGKSGELTKSGKLKKAEDSFVFSSPPAVIMSREAEMKSAEYEADPKMADTIEYNIKDKSGSITDDDLSDRNLPPPAVSWNSSTKSRHSDRSLRSSDSFAFPIEKKCSCSSCYRSNCSQAFCYCLWPRCYPTWSNCCCWNCSRTFSYCWNYSRRGGHIQTSNMYAPYSSTLLTMLQVRPRSTFSFNLVFFLMNFL
ncbi:uncharacterized protein LOC105435703 isoform X2 [Cucumis sativus]|uniref:uncharacterized protein LOC105435703 isoform X2 n=1 Tax=Cucumis sativus TaxID=3659 RepID=UPI0012F4D455|nr:uncharacterized protein LOC105435703 isoform X2 [Cucumis sativus]